MADEIEIKVGLAIRAVRERAGLTQAELARLSMKSVETISNFERGKTLPSIRTLALLAGQLECDITEFFGPAAVGGDDRDPFSRSVVLKAKLLSERDRLLLVGMIDLLSSTSQDCS